MRLVILVSLATLAAAAPELLHDHDPHQKPQIKLLRQFFNRDEQGNYEYGYEQDNGQKVEEVGRSYPGPEPYTGTINKEGFFEYVGPDHQTYRIDYVADEGGFQPSGAHLPQPPAQLREYEELRQQHPELF